MTTTRALLPVITTRRTDRRDRGYLAWVAVAGEIAHLPLETAPIDASTHVLEIYVDGVDEPLVVLADPAGAPDDTGFPLRLQPLDEAHGAALRQELFGAANAAAMAPVSPRETPRALPLLGALVPAGASTKPTLSQPASLSMSHAAALSRTTGVGGAAAARRVPGELTRRTLANGRFVLERHLGSGASGEVYRALHTVLRRPVAVKILHPSLQNSQDYCERFYAEALAASQLDHRNVLRIVDYGQEPDGLLYIVMELLDGRNLQQILEAEGRLPLDRVVSLVSQACAGLGHAHDAGLVHRDIKPENVVVVRRKDDEGNETELVKVCDFGIAHWAPQKPAKSGDDDIALVPLPDSKRIVGTPAYMAPEQIRNETVDARTDVYALGVLLYEMSTGRLPFVSERAIEVLMLHVTEPPARPSSLLPDFDPDLEHIILKALEKDPARRYSDVRALRAALRSIVDDDAVMASGQHRRVSAAALPVPADFAQNTAEALAMVATADARTRGFALQSLGEGLRAAIYEGNVRLARALVGWLEQRFADPGLDVEECEELERALRVVRDPAPAGTFAKHLLHDKLIPIESAAPILAIAGPVAARALLEARRAERPSLELRARFVSFFRATGAGALPVLLAGLEPLVLLEDRMQEALAEDLLRAAPDVRSDVGGELAVRFVRADKPTVGVVALHATVAFWGLRAHALVLGALDSAIEPMRIAAVEALQRLRALDDRSIERLGRIVVGHGAPSVELRVLATSALSLVPAESRGRVIAFLSELLPSHGLVSSLMKAFGPREDARVMLAIVRTLIALDPDGSHRIVTRVTQARPELRVDLDMLVARYAIRDESARVMS